MLASDSLRTVDFYLVFVYFNTPIYRNKKYGIEFLTIFLIPTTQKILTDRLFISEKGVIYKTAPSLR